MLKLFQYNWQVRNEWFKWCESVTEEELLKNRTGGVGGILKTLLHIVDVEYSWICGLQGKPEPEEPSFDDYATLQKVWELSKQYHAVVKPFVASWTSEMETLRLTETGPSGETVSFTYGEIMRHVIAHEIHHVGQLSIWAREIDRKPITANLIGRGLFD